MAVVGHETPSGRRWLLEAKLPCRLGIGDFRCGADARTRTLGPELPSNSWAAVAVQFAKRTLIGRALS